jgi:hypothetical protein
MKYAWGLGFNSNNQEKVLVVYMGMKMLKEDKSLSVIIIDDSELIIEVLHNIIKNSQPILRRIYNRIIIEDQKFQSVEYFHVFQRKNEEDDLLSKNDQQLD